MDLVYLFRVLMKRKWIIIGSGILAAAIAWFLTRNEKYNYRSTARVSTGFAVPDEIKVNDPNFTLFDAEVKFNNAISTWTSASVYSLLSYELILHDLKKPNEAFRKLTKEQQESSTYKGINIPEAISVYQDKLDNLGTLASSDPKEKKLIDLLTLYGYYWKNLNTAITINQVPRTDYIQIDGLSENPDLSAFMVNHVFDQFIRYYRSIRSSKSQESVDTLRSIMDKKKQELDEKNKLLRGEGLVDVTTENTSKFELISQLEQKLADENTKKTEKIYAIRKVNAKLTMIGNKGGSDSSGNNRTELILARKAVNDAYMTYLNTLDKADLDRYNTLQREFNVKYQNVKNPTEKLTDNKAALLNEKSDLEVDLEAADANIRMLQAKIGSLKANASSVSSKGANVETMMNEVKLAEREYLDAKQKYNSAYEMSSSSVNNFRQMQIAQPAIQPEPSKRKIIVAMAGLVTLLSVILIFVLLTYLDSSIKTPGIFSKTVNLKLISMVNFMNLKNRNLKDIVTGKANEEDHAEKDRNNVFRESIRKLRYEIEHSKKKIVLFTSTKKGQGKTTLIQALSYSMSMSKKKILIIDTNFCNNDLTVQLDANPVLEHITGVDGSHSVLQQVRSFAKNIDTENIFVIGSEGGDYTPSEILPRNNILQHLPELSQEFDFIFLEGPPLNDFSDSKELTEYVDGVVAIFSAIHMIKQIDKESIVFYKGLGDKFCGSVLNMVDLENVNVS